MRFNVLIESQDFQDTNIHNAKNPDEPMYY